MRIRTRRNLAATLMLAACLAACEDENALDDDLITINVLQDAFELSATGLDKMTGARRYFITMTGAEATIDVTPGLTSGSGFIQVRGGSSDIIYAEDIQSEIDGPMEPSFPGVWQIDVVVEKASGSFSFRIERVEPEPEPEPEPDDVVASSR